jgi:sugar-specific transcriptional regulator TrmB
MNDEDAVEALDALGLSTYEAKVFIGLQKLGAGSAREVAEVTDVPRSQVYGAADALADYGLVDVHQGSPTRFRPVDIEEARAQLVDRLESTADRAFDHIQTVSGQYEASEARSESLWTVSGSDTITTRAASLVEDATDRVVYGTDEPEHLQGPIAEALEDAAGRGVDVLVVSSEPSVGDRVETRFDDVAFMPFPEDRQYEESTRRMVVCDADTVLVSVVPGEALPHVNEETAFWGSGGAFAGVLVMLLEERLGDLFPAAEVQS